MIVPNDIKARISEIKHFVATAELEQAVKRCIDFCQDFNNGDDNDAILASTSYYLILKEEMQGLVTSEQVMVRKQKVSQRILHIQEEVITRLQEELQLQEAAQQLKPEDSLVLLAENIKKTYRSSSFYLNADRLELRLGEITGLVGENATGKTTLFRILAGDLVPQQGTLSYPTFDPKNNLHWPDLKLKIAYVPQELPAWQSSLLENLHFAAALHGVAGDKNQHAVDYVIQRLGLAMHVDKRWQELSGGYKLRFALAKALVWKPQLLILDEPLAFLDIKTQMIVLNDLRALAKSLQHPMAILLSSQHLHEVEAVADQMLFMRDGQLENLGKTSELGQDRRYNLFEIACDIPLKAFTAKLAGITHHKVWSNGMTYFIATPLNVEGEQLLQHLYQNQIKVTYFRDISRSVKTKFYESIL